MYSLNLDWHVYINYMYMPKWLKLQGVSIVKNTITSIKSIAKVHVGRKCRYKSSRDITDKVHPNIIFQITKFL